MKLKIKKIRLSPKIKSFIGKLMLQIVAIALSSALVLASIILIDDITQGKFTCDNSKKVGDLETLYKLKVNTVQVRERTMSLSIISKQALLRDDLSSSDIDDLMDAKSEYELDIGETKAYIDEIDSYLSHVGQCNALTEDQNNRVTDIQIAIDEMSAWLLTEEEMVGESSI
ncbi:MAG: hypothetical protein PHH45_03000 [Patescibacteria group bacterium]|jgi:hypothetical protein|nr:hypothetical protein [Patescibacteria group bacterium]